MWGELLNEVRKYHNLHPTVKQALAQNDEVTPAPLTSQNEKVDNKFAVQKHVSRFITTITSIQH